MNYLAHAYLSFHQPELLVGNMISDYVKGKKKFDYSPGIQQGIELHRIIDSFTDDHAATKEAKEIFRPHYRLYAGAFVDVVYDHYLATDPLIFNHDSLEQFATDTYTMLEPYTAVFPERFASMFPFMKTQNWLYNYSNKWGIENSLHGVVRRATYLTESATAFALFEEHDATLRQCYQAFFPEMIAVVKNWITER
ncbi:ACP phosphodiesterase [Lacibacter sp. H375]|uniref:acyl carrier protein phosphodiesterase n=1 Tax=Lacibacter sp. H375 TaxID=3133424 RepID=UPI0030BE0328